MKKLVSTFILLVFSLNNGYLYSQILKDTAAGGNGYIEVISDPRLGNLVEKHAGINEKLHGIPGYRVQIYFGSKRKGALEVKTNFSAKYPDTPTYLSYNDPYFKIRAGDCRSKLDAEKLLQLVFAEFPGSFIVDDLICVLHVDCRGK